MELPSVSKTRYNKLKVQEDTKERFKNKKDSEQLIKNFNDFLDSLEHIPFPKKSGANKKDDEEVQIKRKMRTRMIIKWLRFKN